MVECSTTDEAQKGYYRAILPLCRFTAEAQQRTCQACDVLQLSLQTKHLNQIPSTTSAANLATAFLQSVLFNIHRGYDLSGQRWMGTVGRRNQLQQSFGPWSRHGEK